MAALRTAEPIRSSFGSGGGETNFVLMEMTPKEGVVPVAGARVYIGSGSRDVIDHVNRRIDYSELSNSAKLELPFVIQTIVLEDEPRLSATSMMPAHHHRMHAWSCCRYRQRSSCGRAQRAQEGSFKSFADLGRE